MATLNTNIKIGLDDITSASCGLHYAPITDSMLAYGATGTLPNESNIEAETHNDEEWIWVDGYKGTDKNMRCRDFQYEINKKFDMPEYAEIKECRSGFHLCSGLRNVFDYYHIGDGNRFFKVKALVRKSSVPYSTTSITITGAGVLYSNDKLVAKSIIFMEECTTDEILGSFGISELDEWPSEYKELARTKGITFAENTYHADVLVELGYSRAFAEILVQRHVYSVAKAVGSQEDLSMDMKVAYIMRSGR